MLNCNSIKLLRLEKQMRIHLVNNDELLRSFYFLYLTLIETILKK